MKVKKMMSLLEKANPEAEIVMHGRYGNPLLFAVSYVDDDSKVILEDASDNDLGSELDARFERAAEEQVDELDFFIDLVNTGFTLDDIKEYVPERYEYSKAFMEEHGLI